MAHSGLYPFLLLKNFKVISTFLQDCQHSNRLSNQFANNIYEAFKVLHYNIYIIVKIDGK